MKNKLLILAFTTFITLTVLSAANNTIAFIYQSGNNCEYSFRDTMGSRTYTPTYSYWDFGDGDSVASLHAIHNYASNGTYTVIHYTTNGVIADTAIISLTINCKSNLPLKAAFQYNVIDTFGVTSMAYFYNTSEGRPLSFYWSFGDGNVSSQENPIHAYNSSVTQTYTVCLAILDSSSNSDTFCQNITVQPDSCNTFYAAFNWQYDTICNSIVFNDNSYYTASNFEWQFGDGNNSTSKNPVHQYNSTIHQSYTITLKASNQRCVAYYSLKVKPKCRTCYSVVAEIELMVDSSQPSKAKLYNNSTGAIQSHYWDFGDGDTSLLVAPTHVYTNSGQIHLVYVVTDTLNCKDTFDLFFEIDSFGHIKRGNITFTLEVIDNTHTSSIINPHKNGAPYVLYPLPANNLLYIKSELSNPTRLIIHDNMSKMLYSGLISSENPLVIDTQNWADGWYILRDEDGRSYKIIIIH
ncbi:MAG: hypothetical protein IT245_07635 [Bacteroidia bacterium]|nr:hypothetical protein [Bacteroidia bacterium]